MTDIQINDVFEWMSTHVLVASIARTGKSARLVVWPDAGGEPWTKKQPLPLPATATLCTCPRRAAIQEVYANAHASHQAK